MHADYPMLDPHGVVGDVLIAAYDDAAGVTAEFNRNVLAVINRELGGNFEVERHEQVAIWDSESEWVEMGGDIVLQTGEEIRTEISAKLVPQGGQRRRTRGA